VSACDVLPEATLSTAAGDDAIRLSVVRADGPAVIVFYRGAWCPYCNITLRAYQRDLLPTLLEFAQIVAALRGL
jgi:peroxiredoxin